MYLARSVQTKSLKIFGSKLARVSKSDDLILNALYEEDVFHFDHD